VAKIVSRSPAFEGYDPQCFFYVANQLLKNHKIYIEFVRKLYEMQRNARRIREGMDPANFVLMHGTSKERQRDQNRCARKVENDIIHLLRKSEPIDAFKM